MEVLSPSTEQNDRTLKLRDYARHGVGEYWIVDADSREIEQYVLPPGEGEYELKARLTKASRLTSVVLTGFSVPVAAFFDAAKYQRAMRELIGASRWERGKGAGPDGSPGRPWGVVKKDTSKAKIARLAEARSTDGEGPPSLPVAVENSRGVTMLPHS